MTARGYEGDLTGKTQARPPLSLSHSHSLLTHLQPMHDPFRARRRTAAHFSLHRSCRLAGVEAARLTVRQSVSQHRLIPSCIARLYYNSPSVNAAAAAASLKRDACDAQMSAFARFRLQTFRSKFPHVATAFDSAAVQFSDRQNC